MTPNQRHNRRLMVHLLLISAAILALSIGEEMRAERDAEALSEGGQTRQVARSFERGARTLIPRFEEGAGSPEGSGDDVAAQEFLQVLSGEELESWIASTASDGFEQSMTDCLNSWWLLDQGIEGDVQIELVLDTSGLKEAAVLMHSDVPPGPKACFSEALYGAAWPSTAGQNVVAVVDLSFNNAPMESPPSKKPLDEMGEELEEDPLDTGE